eukprot:Transcript_22476.p1 GENE.Transcript_22476~~Transcript_22476.p1  ORF type:complete len:480 (+),score=262.31 Transcript_22476:80-1441(+)
MAPAPTDAPDKENELNSKEMSTAELKETKTAAIATSSAAGKAKVQAPPPLLDVVKSASARAVEMLRDQISTTGLRLQKDVIFSTLEDFERADPDAKRMVVIGVTGAGKSTVLNCLGGWEFKQKPPDYEFEWQDKDGVSPLFEARADTDSCTKKTSFANLSWCGDESRPVVAVDTPGHDDPAGAEIENAESREKLGELAADLHNKLKALGHVHAILVLHNDVHSNRLNPATYTILKMVGEKFLKSEVSCWRHVIVGYSKCNAHETSWRSGLAAKKKALQAEIRKKVETCDVDVPVIALGGGTIEPAPPVATEADASDGYEALWRFVEEAPLLDTSKLQPFEGADVKWQKIIDAKDEAELRAKAAMIWVAVMFKLCLLLVAMFWRAYLLPTYLGYLLLNLPGIYDEAIILVLFAKWLGPKEVMYSAQHFYQQYVTPYTKPYTDQIAEKLGKAKSD